MMNSDIVPRLFRVAASLIALACALGALASASATEAASTSITFQSLGFSTSTQASFTLDFTSPYVEASGRVDLHFQTFGGYVDLVVSINGATVYARLNYPEGVQWDYISFPTGVLDQGINTLQLSFTQGSPTVYEDSLITLDEEAPATGTTFKSLGFSTSTQASFTLDFTNPYIEASGWVDLHFQTFDGYADLAVSINGAPVYARLNYPKGVQWDCISFPTGVLDEGINTLQLSFTQGSPTVYEDSLITLNRSPVATSDAYSANTNVPLGISAPGVLSNDTDPDEDALTAMLVGTVSHGTLTLNADGSFTYTASGGYVGPDSFTYKASDGIAQSSAATVSITVIPPEPTMTSVTPYYGFPGGTLDVTIAGTYLSGASAPSFGPGVTVSEFTVQSSVQLVASITIDTAASPGTRDVSVTTSGGTATLPDGFTVTNSQPPNQPANASPTNGATNVTLSPLLRSSAFSDPDTEDSHAASHWRVTTTAGAYSSPVFDSEADTTNLTQIVLPSGVLDFSTKYYWQVRHQDSSGDWSAWSVETLFTTAAPNRAPNAPSNVSPQNAAVGTCWTPELESSAFSDPDSGDTHAASRWQIYAASGGYSNPLLDSGTDVSNLTTFVVPSGTIGSAGTYYWRTRHQDEHGDWSDWSSETWFTTKANANDPPNRPNNVLPIHGTSKLDLTPNLRSSTFSDPDVGDTHAASQWQITVTAGDYTSAIYDSGRHASSLTLLAVPTGVLDYSTIYYWHVRHQDSQGNWSEYSAETSFTTSSNSDGDIVPVPTPDKTFPFYVLGAACGGMAIIGGSTGYLWRRRRLATALSPYRQQLRQWEEEGYDVSDFKRRWPKWFK